MSLFWRWAYSLGRGTTLCIFLLAITGLDLTAQDSGVGQLASDSETAPATAVHGIVVDTSGAAVQGATVVASEVVNRQTVQVKTTLTDGSGSFSLAALPAGPLAVTVMASGFAPLTLPISVVAGLRSDLGLLRLVPAQANSTVQVTALNPAAEEVAAEEKQRLLGVVPNFFVTYQHNAAPLDTKQKYQLAFRQVVDPVSFVVTGVIAGIEQATNAYSGYGQGARGFGRRYGAAYGDFFISTLLESAILPSLLKQDPRYFVKGEGSVRDRAGYAVANSVVRKGDNGRWQPDYSSILGSLAASGISNAYYPASSRHGASLTFQNAGLGIVSTAAGNLLQEFFFKKLTPSARKSNPASP